MGDVIDLLEFKKKKVERERFYGSLEAWVTHRFLQAGAGNGITSKYELAVEEQQEGDYYLYKYWFPDFDW